MRRERRRNKIIFSLVGVLFFMSVAYATFHVNLNVASTTNISTKWDIKITNVTAGTPTGNAKNAVAPTWDALTANMQANLFDKGDAMEYVVTIQNNGTLDAMLENIEKNIKSDNDAIKITYSGYTKGERLNKGTSKDITVRIEYDSNYTGTIDYDTTTEVEITFNYTQGEGLSGTVDPGVPDTYLVTYNCTENGGNSCSEFNEYIKAGEDIDLTKKGKDTENNMFIGWNTNKDATEVLETISPINDNVTLYAIYREKPLLASNFLANGTTLNSNITKANITSIDIVDLRTTDVPDGVTSWDASEKGNNSVTAWVIDDPNNTGKFKLYLGGNTGVLAPEDSSSLFASFSALTTANLSLLNTSKVTDMYRMFYLTNLLTTLDLSSWDTSKVTDMGAMFYGSNAKKMSLTTLNLTGWDTSKVNNMSYMFYYCPNITNLNFLSNLNTSSVENMSYMLGYCTGLTDVSALKGLNLKKVTTMARIFTNCTGLINVDLSGLNTPSLTTITYMFTTCTNLENVNLSNMNTSDLTNTSYVFNGCTKLTTVNLNGFTASKVTNMQRMFYNCSSLTELDLSSINNSDVRSNNIASMFQGCTNLETIYATTNFTATTGGSAFANCKKLVGGCGTAWASNKATYAMAIVDSSEEPGYFTDISQTIFLDTISSTATTNSITTTITAHSKNTSYAITKYEFSLNDKDWIESLDNQNNPNNTYQFNNLINGANYTIYIRVTNSNNESYTFGKTTTTTTISAPTFTDDKTQQTIAITYPSGCTNGFTCSYKLGDNAAVAVNSSPTNVSYTTSGVLTATTSDGYNVVNSTYIINVESIEPTEPIMKSWDSSSATDFHSSTYKTNITSVDFVDLSINPAPGAVDDTTIWDVSQAENESVIAWVIDDPNNTGKYKLYIGGNKKVYANQNSSYLFYDFESLQTANLSLLDTSNTTNMSYMFSDKSNVFSIDMDLMDLTTLDLSGFDTSNVTNMSHMFYYCNKITTLDLSNWDTSKVTDMSSMFSGCSSLNPLNISHFDTSRVTTMAAMFSYCEKLTTLDVSNWDTSKVSIMSDMFADCIRLTNLNISSFDTSNATNMVRMFARCRGLTSLNLSNFDTSNVTTMEQMFYDSDNFTVLDLSSFDTSKVTSMRQMFAGLSYNLKLTTIYVSDKFKTSQVTSSGWMFYGCTSLVGGNGTTYDSSHLDKSRAKIDGDEIGYFTDGIKPIINNISTSTTSNSITATIAASMAKNNLSITKYEFSIDDGETWINNNTSNIYTFTGLTQEQSYTIKVRVTGSNNETKIKETVVKGISKIDIPIFSEGESTLGKIVTITYPTGCGSTYTCTYTKDSDSPVTVTTREVNVDFTSSGTLVATATDGIATASSSYTTTIFSVMKRYAYNTDFYNNTYRDNITSVDFVNLNTNPAPGAVNDTTIWDVSEKGNGSVIAWVIDDPNNTGKYKLYIGGDGKVYANPNSSNMFYYFTSLKTINFNGKFDTSNVTDMSYMFYSCSSLTSLNLSNFDTSNVTSMNSMFSYCTGLTTLNLNTFDTSSVIYISSMFYNCSALTNLNISNFNTLNITNMERMFEDCSALTILDLSTFDTSKVTSFQYMFWGCSSLTSLNLSNWETPNVTNLSTMFRDCSVLTTLDLSTFDTSKVTNVSQMLYNCSSLTSLNISNWDMGNVNDISFWLDNTTNLTTLNLSNATAPTDSTSLFSGLSSLTTLNLSNFDTSEVTNMKNMFYNCSSLETLNVSSFDTSNVTSMYGMFSICRNLSSLNVSGFDTSNVTSMYQMFNNCNNLTSLDVTKFDTSNVTSILYMFSGCSKLTTLDVSNFDTSNLSAIGYMFQNCSSLTTLDLSNWDTSKITRTNYMFSGCSSLTTIYVSDKFKVFNVTSSDSMFYNCKLLVGGNGTTYNSKYTDKAFARIDAPGTPGYFTDANGPVITSVSTTATTSSITTVVTAITGGNVENITNYQYSIDNGRTWATSNSNTYTFNDLDADTTYTIKVKVNGVKASTMAVTTKTKGLGVPKFTRDEDTITITYPTGCGDGYTCQYKRSTDADFTTATTTRVNLDFTTNGTYTLIATITDNTTTINSTYTFVRNVIVTFTPQYYTYTTGFIILGNAQYNSSNWTQNSATLNRDYYLGNDFNGSGVASANYACFVLDNTQYCMRGKDGSSGTNYYAENKALLSSLKDAGKITCSTWSDSLANCSGGSLGVLVANSNGHTAVGASNSAYCYASTDGDAHCA